MDPTTDMADRQEPGDGAGLLGPSARAFGKAALVAYWIACVAVIAFGLSQMDWASPQPQAAPHAAAVAQPAPARPVAPASPDLRRPATTAKVARPAPSPVERAQAPEGWAPPAWISALALLSIGGPVLLSRPWRRRGSRALGRFSGRGRRLGSMRQGSGRRWGF